MAHAPAAARGQPPPAALAPRPRRARSASPAGSRWLLTGGVLVATQRYDAYLLLPAMLSGAAVPARSLANRGLRGAAPDARSPWPSSAGAFLLAALPLILLSVRRPAASSSTPRSSGRRCWETGAIPTWARSSSPRTVASSPGRRSPSSVSSASSLFARRERRVALVPARHPGPRGRRARQQPDLVGRLVLRGAAPHRGLRHPQPSDSAPSPPRRCGVPVPSDWSPSAGLVAMNLSLSTQHRRGALPPDDTVSFTRAMQGVVADVYGLRRASTLLAGQLALRGPLRRRPRPFRRPLRTGAARAVGRFGLGAPEDAAVLGRGWSRPRGEGSDLYRWALGADATLLFTLSAVPPTGGSRLRGRPLGTRTGGSRCSSSR